MTECDTRSVNRRKGFACVSCGLSRRSKNRTRFTYVCVCVNKRVWIQHRDISRYLTMSDCKLLHRKPGDKASSPLPSLKLTSKLTICSYWVPLRSAWNLDKQSGREVIGLRVRVSWGTTLMARRVVDRGLSWYYTRPAFSISKLCIRLENTSNVFEIYSWKLSSIRWKNTFPLPPSLFMYK